MAVRHSYEHRQYSFDLGHKTQEYMDNTVFDTVLYTPDYSPLTLEKRSPRDSNLAVVSIEMGGDRVAQMIRSRRLSFTEKIGYFGKSLFYIFRSGFLKKNLG